MDFSIIKEKVIWFKDKAVDAANKTLEKWAEAIQKSSFTLTDLSALEWFIAKSKNYYNDVMKKEITKCVIVIFAPKNTDFYKKALYILPIVYTKSWTLNIEVKIVDSSIEWLDISKYNITELPSLVLFENEKVVKVVAGEEKINKIVTGLTLDIISTIKSTN